MKEPINWSPDFTRVEFVMLATAVLMLVPWIFLRDSPWIWVIGVVVFLVLAIPAFVSYTKELEERQRREIELMNKRRKRSRYRRRRRA